MSTPTEDDKQTHEEALKLCDCVERNECHFKCGVELAETMESDEDAWCDWVFTDPFTKERFHVLAHFFCANGQIGFERA